MKKLASVIALSIASSCLWAQAAAKPLTVALVAAVGEQVDVVRQRPGTHSNIEPFSRKSFPLNSQALNFAVLRGLDRAIEDEEPDARRVLLAWNTTPEVRQQLASASASERDSIVLAALKEHLKSLPARANWDRIEAIVPSYFYEGISGMGTKLYGVGFYVQPLTNGAISIQWNPSFDSMANLTTESEPSKDSDYRTVDPNTGNVGHSYTFIATYMYFQRVTLDARTLEVLSVKRHFDNIKYADPKATAIDVADQIPLHVMTAKLLDMAEQSAYSSVRGKSYVTSTTPRALPATATPAEPAASTPR